jgi:hypothetical protein
MLALVLAACGGGGEGEGDASPPSVAPGWGTPALVETDNAGDATLPQVALDADGNAIAVWIQNDGPYAQVGTRANVWANRFNAARGTWGTAQLMENNAGFVLSARIAVHASGNAIAIWDQYDDTSTTVNLWASRFSASSGSWGTPQAIAPQTFASQIAVDGSGNAIAVWIQSTGAGLNIGASRFNAGSGTWGMAQGIVAENTNGMDSPQIAFGANGDAFAVWSQFDGTRLNAWANRFSAASGTWGTAQLIETESAGSALALQIAVDGSGNAIATASTLRAALGASPSRSGPATRSSRILGSPWTPTAMRSPCGRSSCGRS